MQCKFYPCHFKQQDCTFCWCPFYPCLEDITGGKYYEVNSSKIWDCSACKFNHLQELSKVLRFRWTKRWWLGRKDGWFDMYIIKRNGKKELYVKDKIVNAIHKASMSIKHKDVSHSTKDFAEYLANQVEDEIFKSFIDKLPSVEDIQDVVESVLMRSKMHETAKAYILHRQERSELRRLKAQIGVVDELKLSVNAVNILKERYLLKNNKGEVVESTREMFRRIAKAVGSVTKEHSQPGTAEFYEIMSTLKFLPNSPTLFNAGTGQGCLSACFVLPIEDSIESIMSAAYYSALIQKFGGGVGCSYSRLREKGANIRSTHGRACGPLAVMNTMSEISIMITQGGKRNGANMAILRIDHPDIFEFVDCKKNNSLSNFNISVAVTDEFMNAVSDSQAKDEFDLRSPLGDVVKTVSAKELFSKIVDRAWECGDPGLIFIDEINRKHQILGETIESTNPCGEQPLLPYESCNLGSINVEKFVKQDGSFDWEDLRNTINIAVVFLDNVIEIANFPKLTLREYSIDLINEITKSNRKIGLGIMGFANALIRMNMQYDSEESFNFADKLMALITKVAREKSEELGALRGSFPNFAKSVYASDYKCMRNATVTTIAPTGTISIIADTSSGIEPLFALMYKRKTGFTEWYEINSLFKEMLRKHNLYTDELLSKISNKSSIQDVAGFPEQLKRVLVTAHDVSAEAHVKMQTIIQRHTDNAVSKTINLPSTATAEDVRNALVYAWKNKVKGITVYRNNSKLDQPLQVANPFSSSKCDITGHNCD